MASRPDRVDRILVLLEGGTGDETLEAAADLAERGGLPLVGLLVQDLDLLASAGLPFAREIGFSSGRARPLSTAEVEARLSERAERYRRTLAELARRHGIDTTLEIGHGRRNEAVRARVYPDDVLVARRTPWAQRPGGLLEALMGDAHCAVVLLGRPVERATVSGPMVVLDGSDGATRALSRAIALARHTRSPLTLLLGPGTGDTAGRHQARQALEEHGIEPHFREIPRLTPTAVHQLARNERSRLLFISRDTPLLRQADADLLTESEDIPLVVVP